MKFSVPKTEHWDEVEESILSFCKDGVSNGSVSSKSVYNLTSFLPTSFLEVEEVINESELHKYERLVYAENNRPIEELREKFKTMEPESCKILSNTRLFYIVDRLLNTQLPVVGRLLAHDVQKMVSRQDNITRNKIFTKKHYSDQIENITEIIKQYKAYLLGNRSYRYDTFTRFEFSVPMTLNSSSGHAIGFNILTYTVTVCLNGHLLISSRARRLTFSKHCIQRMLERRPNAAVSEVFKLIGKNLENHTEVADECTFLWGSGFEINPGTKQYQSKEGYDREAYEKTIFCLKEENSVGFVPAKMLLTPAYPPENMHVTAVNVAITFQSRNGLAIATLPTVKLKKTAKYDVTFMCRTFLPASYINNSQTRLMNKLSDVYTVLENIPSVDNGTDSRSMLEGYLQYIAHRKKVQENYNNSGGKGNVPVNPKDLESSDLDSTKSIIANEVSTLINQMNLELL